MNNVFPVKSYTVSYYPTLDLIDTDFPFFKILVEPLYIKLTSVLA